MIRGTRIDYPRLTLLGQTTKGRDCGAYVGHVRAWNLWCREYFTEMLHLRLWKGNCLIGLWLVGLSGILEAFTVMTLKTIGNPTSGFTMKFLACLLCVVWFLIVVAPCMRLLVGMRVTLCIRTTSSQGWNLSSRGQRIGTHHLAVVLSSNFSKRFIISW